MPAPARRGAQRITLLRDTDGDGKPDIRTTFLDHLNSPFGVALVGGDLYVANTDAIVRFPYTTGQTTITAPGTILAPLPGGPIDHHWTKSLAASPDGTKLYVGVGSNSNITENGIGAELDRAAIWEVDRASGAHRIFASGLRTPQWPVVGATDQAAMGGRQRTRRTRTEPRARLHDVGEGRRLLRLAVQLLGPARRSARDAATARSGREGDHAGL